MCVTLTILDIGPTTQNLALGTADVLITKDDGKSTVAPGEPLDYVIALVNQGSITATGIVVTDTLPLYLEYRRHQPIRHQSGAWRLCLDAGRPGAGTDGFVHAAARASQSRCPTARPG